MGQHEAGCRVHPQAAIVRPAMSQGPVHPLAPLDEGLLRFPICFPQTGDSTHRERPLFERARYEAFSATGKRKWPSTSRKRKAAVAKRPAATVLGMATARYLLRELDTVVIDSNLVPNPNPTAPTAHVATSRSAKGRISLQPMGPNLVCSFQIM